MTREELRLHESLQHKAHWRRWGPYLSARQWGTVREDYSADGTAWEYFPHDQARSRAYRWGEDGMLGISDNHQRICFALSLWNERDPILKERLFGLSNGEGNHGEDVKEYCFYLDNTPTHSYMRALYRYPQAEFPYRRLIEESRRRTHLDPEFELVDTGIFDQNRFFDIFAEYAKAGPHDILIRIRTVNRGPDAATLHLLPTVWFRNSWSWTPGSAKPLLHCDPTLGALPLIRCDLSSLSPIWLAAEDQAEVLFTENDTNYQRLFGVRNTSPYVKDAFHDYIIERQTDRVNPERVGTKASLHYCKTLAAGETWTLCLRFGDLKLLPALFGTEFAETFAERRQEADEFYRSLAPEGISPDAANIQRQAFAGLLWNKQFYHYVVADWLRGDPGMPPPPPGRVRNKEWSHVYTDDILSMPDKWEYPWFGAWDLAFHCIPLAMIDPEFAKRQLILLTREWYMHPNGQLPAYEWAFGDVHPPVQAWAAWRIYKIEKKMYGKADRPFLERVFQKLLLNFTWWVNRKDAQENNIFEGGFLGLDNIAVFDRSHELPAGGRIEQSDATSWMAMYCLNLFTIAIELAQENPSYEDIASKFFEHFLRISNAMNHVGSQELSLWDEEDGFFYDCLQLPDSRTIPLRVRSVVGLIPIFAVETLELDSILNLPGFNRRMNWFLEHRPELSHNVTCRGEGGMCERRILSIVSPEQLRRILSLVLDEQEFLSPFGLRALSRCHKNNPYNLSLNGNTYSIGYEPDESASGSFGGNSNWRGPIWMPLNFLMIESLQKFHHYLGKDFKVECPTGSGNMLTLWEVSQELSQRLIQIFAKDGNGTRPVYRRTPLFRDEHWNDYMLFYEYFSGEDGAGLGAMHQTGWTSLVAKLIQQREEYRDLAGVKSHP